MSAERPALVDESRREKSTPNIATTRILYASESAVSAGAAKPWIWPLPCLDGVHPSIVSPDPPDPTMSGDGVIQLGYPDRTSSPDFVPVFAPHAGIITYAVRGEQGTTLCLDHPAGWSTHYSDLEHVLTLSTDRFRRGRKVRVRGGDVLGHVRSALRIRFGLARLIDGEWMAIDPAVVIHSWSAQPWFREPTSRVGYPMAG